MDNKYTVIINSTNVYFPGIKMFCGKLLKKLNNIKLEFMDYDVETNCDTSGSSELINNIYSIPLGQYKIPFNDSNIYIKYETIGDTCGLSNNVSIYERLTLQSDTSMELLDNFLKECYRDSKVKSKKDKVNIFKWNSYWSRLSSLKKRSLNTIYLDEKIKNDILTDIQKFMKERDVYDNFGIPYKKNYLLSGIPGTGKTSLIFSIASEIDYSIYMIPFTADIDDNKFTNALKNIDKKAILLLEDVDALFNKRDSKSKSAISFSGLINILDGLARKDGLIVFLTTNHLEKLDEALIRPGRIDKYFQFTYATNEQIKKMFTAFMPDQLDNLDKFLQHLENIKTTTSILQKFFFENRDCDNILDKKIIKKFKNLCKQYVKDKNHYSMYT